MFCPEPRQNGPSAQSLATGTLHRGPDVLHRISRRTTRGPNLTMVFYVRNWQIDLPISGHCTEAVNLTLSLVRYAFSTS